jgi:hypothetical protein
LDEETSIAEGQISITITEKVPGAFIVVAVAFIIFAVYVIRTIVLTWQTVKAAHELQPRKDDEKK